MSVATLVTREGQRILDAAIPLFARLGYGSASVRELAEAAGVTKPTLYYHFGSKEDLFHELVRYHLDELLRERVFSRALGYNADDEVDLLAHDPAMSIRRTERSASSARQ